MGKKIVIASVILCILLSSCTFGLDDDFLEIPLNPEWGVLLIDGTPQSPTDGMVRVKALSGIRSLEFRPNVEHGWAFRDWTGLIPQPVPIADVPYSASVLSTENPFAFAIDESCVSTYQYLIPRVDRFAILDFFANSSGKTAFSLAYPDGSRKTFIADARGGDARDVTALLPYASDAHPLAMSETELLQSGLGAEPGVKALDLESGLQRTVVLGGSEDYFMASPGGILVERETTRYIDGQRSGISTVDIFRADAGTLSISRDFSASARIIRSAALGDSFFAYTSSAIDTQAGEELHCIDIQSGVDTRISFPGDFIYLRTDPVMGSPNLLFITGDPVLPGNPTMREFRCFVYDQSANRLYPLLRGGPSFAYGPVFKDEGLIYLRAAFNNETESQAVLWNYAADSYASLGIEATILYSTPSGAYLRSDFDPILKSMPPNPARGRILFGDPTGTTVDITPYSAILE
jgi:hypothetical protein